jgi:hypothetical protein
MLSNRSCKMLHQLFRLRLGFDPFLTWNPHSTLSRCMRSPRTPLYALVPWLTIELSR